MTINIFESIKLNKFETEDKTKLVEVAAETMLKTSELNKLPTILEEIAELNAHMSRQDIEHAPLLKSTHALLMTVTGMLLFVLGVVLNNLTYSKGKYVSYPFLSIMASTLAKMFNLDKKAFVVPTTSYSRTFADTISQSVNNQPVRLGQSLKDLMTAMGFMSPIWNANDLKTATYDDQSVINLNPTNYVETLSAPNTTTERSEARVEAATGETQSNS